MGRRKTYVMTCDEEECNQEYLLKDNFDKISICIFCGKDLCEWCTLDKLTIDISSAYGDLHEEKTFFVCKDCFERKKKGETYNIGDGYWITSVSHHYKQEAKEHIKKKLMESLE